MTTQPLDGVLVVSLEQAVAAPIATCRLVDAGARVIKLERAEGDFARDYDDYANGQSTYFAWANRGKESVIVDIKNPDDLSFVKNLLSKADVFIQNLAVGAAARSGLDSSQLREDYPQLITCDVSGYGEDGPYATMKAYDLLVQAESGLVSVSGHPGELGRVGVSVCDVATGISVALAVNEALHARVHSGKGSAIKISLFDVIAEWMTVPLLQYDYTGRAPDRVGLAHPSIVPYGGFVSSDNATVVISIQNQREWISLVTQVLDRPDLASNSRYGDNASRMTYRVEVDNIVQKVFATLPRKELEKKLRSARIAYGSVNTVSELSTHPQLRRWTIQSETGDISLPAHPDAVKPQRPDLWIPRLGEHTELIKEEFSGSS